MQSFDDDFEYDESDNIVSPGKFEQEPAWVPLLWDRVLSGFSDVSLHDGSMAIDAFKLDDGIAALTGMQADPTRYVALWESDNGFVTHMLMTKDELDACEPCDADFDGYDLGGESDY